MAAHAGVRGDTLKVALAYAGGMDVPLDILRRYRTITVVGCSDTPGKDAHEIPAFMRSQGYRIVPVNPNHDRVLGEEAYPTVLDAPDAAFVDVFRPSEECADVARRAVDAGAEAIWLQLGIRNEEARRIAEDAGVLFVQDRCVMVEWRRLQRQPTSG